MDIRNRFNPIRVTGRGGLVTTEELSRVEDLIKVAIDELARQLIPVAPSPDPPGTGAPSALARYWLSVAHASLPNGVDMGALGPGILQQQVAAGVSTPGLVTVAAPLAYAGSTLSHATSGVAPGAYPFATVTVNATGHVTAIAAGTAAPIDATYITQTPHAGLSNEQALSLLPASGILSAVNGTGVVSSFAVGANRVPFGSGVNGALTDSANLTWNGSRFAAGTSTPWGQTVGHFAANVNDYRSLSVSNANTGTAAQALFSMLQREDATAAAAHFGLTGSGFTTSGSITAGTVYFQLGGGSGNMIYRLFQASGDFIWLTTAGDVERMRLTNGGALRIAGLGAGGLVKAVAAPAGELQLAVAGTDYLTPAGTTPGTYDRVTVAGSGLVTSGTSYAFTNGSILYAVSNQPAQDNANFFYDAGNVRWGFGTNTPASAATATWDRSVNGSMGHFVHNGNAGNAAQAMVFLQTAASATFGTTPYAVLSATGPSFTPVGPIAAGSAYLELNSAVAGNALAIGSVGGDVIAYTGAGRTERMKVANGGNVSIANLTAGGVTYATAATGVLKIGTSAEVAAAITWPASDRILVSNGTTVAPIGYANFTYDGGELLLGTSAVQSWYNVTGANYERARAFWSSNVWNLSIEQGGSGTLRAMRINGGLGLNAAPDSISAAYAVTLAPTATRDRVWLGVGGITATDGVTRGWVTIDPADTSVTTATVPLIAALRVTSANYTVSGGGAITLTASIYADEPQIGGGTGATTWAMYANGKTFATSVQGTAMVASEDFGVGSSLQYNDANTTPLFGIFGATPVIKQAVTGLTNNVTSGGTNDQVDNWTNLTTYATDAAAIRNAVYQLARKLQQLRNALATYGLV